MEAIRRDAHVIDYVQPNESLPRKIWRALTLNGFLIPRIFLKKSLVFQAKNFRGVLRDIFGYQRVLYEYEPLEIGYIAEHDKSLFFSGIARYFAELFKLLVSFRRLKKSYKANIDQMTSKEFWKNVYQR
jgi:hypothetical protein